MPVVYVYCFQSEGSQYATISSHQLNHGPGDN